MKNKGIHKLIRPLIHVLLGWTIGIVGGTIFLKQEYSSLFLVMIFSLMLIIGYFFYYGIPNTFVIIVSIVLSTCIFLYAPIHIESHLIKLNKVYELVGVVTKVRETDYYKWVTIKSVSYKDDKGLHSLKSKVQIRMNKDSIITPNDYLKVKAERLIDEPQMNPSDFDYATYLKSQNIVASLKQIELIEYQKIDPFNERLMLFLNAQLEALYSKEKVGIMEAALLGDDDLLDEETESLYNASGISHVLCISGFHVSVMVSILTFLLCLMPIPYHLRQYLIIVGIWAYALISGNGPSTMRASIMATILYLGRCFWEEEDGLTSLSLAAILILVISPYQLFQAGFQLSFAAVLGIFICLNIIEQKERMGDWKYPNWQKNLFMWLSIQLLTWPILSYHFFEIPFLISLINLIVVPIFSWIIIGGWISLILYILHIPISQLLAQCIESTLGVIDYVTYQLMKLPFSTLCIGRPRLIAFILYGGIVIILYTFFWGYVKKNQLIKVMMLIGCGYPLMNFFSVSTLRISLLYVGQGDSTVIETPKKQILLIDGGNFGKGQIVERYIKYRGKREIDAIFVSHSDGDHIGGLIEILDTNINVNKVFISETDHSELLQKFLSQCDYKNIPVYELSQYDTLMLGDISITCLAPKTCISFEESNNNSLVCELNYGNFSALFTGDKEKTSDADIYDTIGPISLLKVSHHGSRTGTSKELLLKLNPMYAMISCGRKNLYGHPHGEVIELLEEADIKVSRTDINGTICYETDGDYLTETMYREEA